MSAAARELWKQQLKKQRAEGVEYDRVAHAVWEKAKADDKWRQVIKASTSMLVTDVAWSGELRMDAQKIAGTIAQLYGVLCWFVVGDESPGWFEISVPRPDDLSEG